MHQTLCLPKEHETDTCEETEAVETDLSKLADVGCELHQHERFFTECHEPRKWRIL